MPLLNGFERHDILEAYPDALAEVACGDKKGVLRGGHWSPWPMKLGADYFIDCSCGCQDCFCVSGFEAHAGQKQRKKWKDSIFVTQDSPGQRTKLGQWIEDQCNASRPDLPDIGARIEVYWPMDKEWFPGTILSYGETTGTAFVKYDDSEEENLHLIMEQYRLITDSKTRAVVEVIDLCPSVDLDVIDLSSSEDLDEMMPGVLPKLTHPLAQAASSTQLAVKSEPDSHPHESQLPPNNSPLSSNGSGTSQPVTSTGRQLLDTKAKSRPSIPQLGKTGAGSSAGSASKDACQHSAADSTLLGTKPGLKAKLMVTSPNLAPSGLRQPLPVRATGTSLPPLPSQLQPQHAQLQSKQKQLTGPSITSPVKGAVLKSASKKSDAGATLPKRGHEGAFQQAAKRSKQQAASSTEQQGTARPAQQQPSAAVRGVPEASAVQPAATKPRQQQAYQLQQQPVIKEEEQAEPLAAPATAVLPKITSAPAPAAGLPSIHTASLAVPVTPATASAGELVVPCMGTAALLASPAAERDDLLQQLLQQLEAGADLGAAAKRKAIAALISAVANKRATACFFAELDRQDRSGAEYKLECCYQSISHLVQCQSGEDKVSDVLRTYLDGLLRHA